MNDTVAMIGKIIPLQAAIGRDCIHVAVVPLTAAERLSPGQHVSLTKDVYQDATSLNPESRIGIVDPFLTVPVEKGEMCWVFIYPGTITGLRHIFTHPAFRTKLPPLPAKKAVDGK